MRNSPKRSNGFDTPRALVREISTCPSKRDVTGESGRFVAERFKDSNIGFWKRCRPRARCSTQARETAGYQAISADGASRSLPQTSTQGPRTVWLPAPTIWSRVVALIGSGPRWKPFRFPRKHSILWWAAASFHYVGDMRETLKEFHRVLEPSGRIIIFDSPWYEYEVDGKRAQTQRASDCVQEYGLDETLAETASFLAHPMLDDLIHRVGFVYERIPVWPGPRRSLQALKARLVGQRIASFPLIILRK